MNSLRRLEHMHAHLTLQLVTLKSNVSSIVACNVNGCQANNAGWYFTSLPPWNEYCFWSREGWKY